MTLGQLLQKRRKELSRTLEQVSASTKIHINILSALEQDQYSKLPARTFTRGFVVSYARALQLDSDQILSEYHDFLESKFEERPDRDLGHQGYVFEGKEIEQNRRWLIIGASVAGLFALAVLLVFKPQNHRRQAKHKELEAEVTPVASASLALASLALASPSMASSPSTPTPAPSPSPKIEIATASPSPTPKADPLNKGDSLLPHEVRRKITMQALEDSWVRYQADDRPIQLIILRKDKFLVIKAKTNILVETKTDSKFLFRTKKRDFEPLSLNTFIVNDAGLLESSQKTLGPSLPGTVPQPKTQP